MSIPPPPRKGATVRYELAQLVASLTECASLQDEIDDFVLNRSNDSMLWLSSADWNHVYHVKLSVSYIHRCVNSGTNQAIRDRSSTRGPVVSASTANTASSIF